MVLHTFGGSGIRRKKMFTRQKKNSKHKKKTNAAGSIEDRNGGTKNIRRDRIRANAFSNSKLIASLIGNPNNRNSFGTQNSVLSSSLLRSCCVLYGDVWPPQAAAATAALQTMLLAWHLCACSIQMLRTPKPNQKPPQYCTIVFLFCYSILLNLSARLHISIMLDVHRKSGLRK